MSPVVHPVVKKDDRWPTVVGLANDKLQQLAALTIDAVEPTDIGLIEELANLWIDGKVFNQPIRASRNYVCEIGHPTFDEARKAWLTLTKQ